MLEDFLPRATTMAVKAKDLRDQCDEEREKSLNANETLSSRNLTFIKVHSTGKQIGFEAFFLLLHPVSIGRKEN